MKSRGISNDGLVVLHLLLILLKTVNGHKTLEIDDEKVSRDYPRDSLSNFTEFANNYGYISEEYTVITEDEYILSVFRIPKGKNCKGRVRHPPVLLMHGLLQSSDSWLDAGPSAGLAFLIPDACYDLWVGNVRGNNYGRRHVRLDPDTDSEFWNFSSHEMGRFDVPATIDLILNNTGANELIYIGFSQGCRILFTMCSETSGYCERVKAFIAIAPAVRFKYYRSIPFRLISYIYAFIEPVLSTPRELEVTQKGDLVQEVSAFFCKSEDIADIVCRAVLSLIDSYDPGSILTQTIRVLFGHFPTGTSARNIAFYGQNTMAARFQKYDYGSIRNLKLYGSINPPLYDLNRTAMPVIIIYGESDFLVDPKDNEWLSSQLPNVVESYMVKRETWNHFDVCYSQHTKKLILPKISQYLRKYSTKRS